MPDLKSRDISQALTQHNALWNTSHKHLDFRTQKIRGKASGHANGWFALTFDKFWLKIKYAYLKEKVYNHLNSIASLLWSLPQSLHLKSGKSSGYKIYWVKYSCLGYGKLEDMVTTVPSVFWSLWLCQCMEGQPLWREIPLLTKDWYIYCLYNKHLNMKPIFLKCWLPQV